MKEIHGGITSVRGIKASGIRCGIKDKGKDLALITSESMAEAAGVFTTNRVKSASVILCNENLKKGKGCKGIIINSGNANTCTKDGYMNAREMVEQISVYLDVPFESILIASTGVIGIPLPMERIRKGIPELIHRLSTDGGMDAAEAILTTDNLPKLSAVEYEIDGKAIRIGGIAKGSGMIYPKLATMLSFLVTDVSIDRDSLQCALEESVKRSFNRITVDGDTSTNDTVLCLANGLAGNNRITDMDENMIMFMEGLNYVTQDLSKKIVRDGEGATKFIEVCVKGAVTSSDAKRIAFSIANSNLVKTAFFGESPNWGRIMAAAGTSGVEFDVEKVDIYFNEEKVVERGIGIERDSKERIKKTLKEKEITVSIDLHIGEEKISVWTSDLTYDYIRINADYKT
ncbi:MAG: bifunctional glutamate N-acetyltransferase/amino-acid acetyltransferase ArgJ [Nitrospinae bacterium]|nr:bifunctional glutamate N-acetyltransferase/amino-acid acetyltransferase ArgJ [Nitrospinota bacterium]